MSNMVINATIWNTEHPPKDGTHIIAMGGVMLNYGLGVTKEPFLEEIYWSEEHQTWLRSRDGMDLRAALEDEVIIHYWLPSPNQNAGGNET